MNEPILELKGLSVRVNEVIYMPSLDAPADKPHPFVYFITILNESKKTVTIRGRKWIIREDDGETTVVEGDGVVGQAPEIEPDGEFSYNSYHVTRTGATANGSFFGDTRDGTRFYVRIPPFRLNVPGMV